MSESLTVIERDNLNELEETIQKNLSAFYEVGFALMQIRDNRLYREIHGTFGQYCKEKWGFESNYARRLIRSSEVMDNLKTVPVGTLPDNERAIRPLTRIKDPNQQREVYRKAVKTAPSGKVTARHIEQTVMQIKRPEGLATEIPPKSADHTPPANCVSNAWEFATMAISQLERIRNDDPHREIEMKRVMAWIEDHINGGKVKCRKKS